MTGICPQRVSPPDPWRDRSHILERVLSIDLAHDRGKTPFVRICNREDRHNAKAPVVRCGSVSGNGPAAWWRRLHRASSLMGRRWCASVGRSAGDTFEARPSGSHPAAAVPVGSHGVLQAPGAGVPALPERPRDAESKPHRPAYLFEAAPSAGKAPNPITTP